MSMQKQSSEWSIPLLLAAGAGLALWYYWGRIATPEPAPPPAVVQQPAESRRPLHPVEAAGGGAIDKSKLVPLPSLDQSDDYFKLEVVDIFGDSIEGMLADSAMIERIAATIDSLPRSHVAERIRPLNRLAGQFLVDGQDGSGMYSINPGNYRRYDLLVTLISSADPETITEVYRRFYPLFQSAYVDLGYPDGYFNDRLVEVIDQLLATPEISDRVALVRPNVLYEYADPKLEALSSGQKLLLRMGRENASRVKQTLRELRAHITAM